MIRNKTALYLGLFLFVALLSCCSQGLDLDDETLLKIEKQDKMTELDALFDLAFEDPARAQKDFDLFVREQLITENLNFLSDYDVNNKYIATELAIKLNLNDQSVKENLNTNNLFDIYLAKYQSETLNKTLRANIPQQLRQGERYEKFNAKLNEMDSFLNNSIRAFREQSLPDPRVAGHWSMMGAAYNNDFSKIYPITFDLTLGADKSLDFESFFFLPAIPYVQGNPTPKEEKDVTTDMLLSPLKYDVYDGHICFFFHLANDYNQQTKEGKLERVWIYEYEYELMGENLLLKNPRLIHYMFPSMIYIAHDSDLFQSNYLDNITGFGNGFTLTKMAD